MQIYRIENQPETLHFRLVTFKSVNDDHDQYTLRN